MLIVTVVLHHNLAIASKSLTIIILGQLNSCVYVWPAES